ncbi:MAG: MerR family transcriptional regulator [Beijerinckiaceae bacterium]|nr:MerR family transcriptional regulator [Beijerinckiaceae bacterium]
MIVEPPYFSIGELARRTGLSQRAIHYYESFGLLSPVEREGRGYRYYDESSEQRLNKIGQLKRIGLTLEEIRDVIDLYFTAGMVADGKRKVLGILRRHLRDTEARLEELSDFRRDLVANIARLEQLALDAAR